MSVIDSSVNLGNIITILVVGGGIITTFVTTRSNVTSMKEDLVDLKSEVKKLSEVMISIARQEERANAADQRALLQGQRIDEMRSALSRMESLRTDQLQDQFNRLIATMETRP